MKKKQDNYQKLTQLITIISVTALAVFIVLVIIIFASGGIKPPDNSEKVTSGQNKTETESENSNNSDNSGLVFPGLNKRQSHRSRPTANLQKRIRRKLTRR